MVNSDSRESWDSYFMGIALTVGTRATCCRRKVGAILVKNKSIKGTGYNGAPAGVVSCIEAGGCMLDGNGSCIRTVHAETNLILQTDSEDRSRATIYSTDRPCWNCALVLANSGISELVYARGYWRLNDEFNELMRQAGITVRIYEPVTPHDKTLDEIATLLGEAADQAGRPVEN